MYGRIKNDVVEYAPAVFTTPEGNKIINFNKSVELMLRYGFREVVDIQPAYNPKNQEVVYSGYKIDDTGKIILNYVIMDKPEEEPTLEERVKELELMMAVQMTIIDEEIND